jgi:cysteinyl-tRNA synthetase
MIEKQLGRTIDIHGGGLDLIFPHHENEIAQSECAHDEPLARYWLHNGFLTMDAEKMSKSLGNVVTMRWLREEGWHGEVLRYALLSAHYREPMDWNDGLLKQSEASLNRLYGALERVWDADAKPAAPASVLEALCDDLNTPKAIAELFALASVANKAESAAEKAQAKADLLGAGVLLGVLQSEPNAWFKGGGDDDSAIDALVALRLDARKAKNWAEADRLRGELDKLGVVVMDDPKAGTSTWRRA